MIIQSLQLGICQLFLIYLSTWLLFGFLWYALAKLNFDLLCSKYWDHFNTCKPINGFFEHNLENFNKFRSTYEERISDKIFLTDEKEKLLDRIFDNKLNGSLINQKSFYLDKKMNSQMVEIDGLLETIETDRQNSVQWKTFDLAWTMTLSGFAYYRSYYYNLYRQLVRFYGGAEGKNNSNFLNMYQDNKNKSFGISLPSKIPVNAPIKYTCMKNLCLNGVQNLIDAIQFSFETSTTIGYGRKYISSECKIAQFIFIFQVLLSRLLDIIALKVMAEAILSISGDKKNGFYKLVAGCGSFCEDNLVFLEKCLSRRKLENLIESRKTGRSGPNYKNLVAFTKKAVISRRNDHFLLIFRLCPTSNIAIINATAKVIFIEHNKSSGSKPINLPLITKDIVMDFPSQLIHVIDRKSPFWRILKDQKMPCSEKMETDNDGDVDNVGVGFKLMVCFEGTNCVNGGVVSYQHIYDRKDILKGFYYGSVTMRQGLDLVFDWSNFDHCLPQFLS